MQLKKNPRYDETTARYEDGQYSEAPDASFEQPQPPEGQPARQARSAAVQAEGDAPARTSQAARAESLIDGHSSFDGKYETEQDLRIEGSISGEIVCRGVLTIEREASARARIQTRDAQIRGRLEGDIVCTGRLLLSATAIVTGTMKAASLVVEEGATVSGSVDTTGGAVPMPEASRPPRETVTRAAPAPAPDAAVTRESAPASPGARNGRREVPTFALVSSDDRSSLDRN